MKKIFSIYNTPDTIPAPAGNEYAVIWLEKVTKHGKKLVENGLTNIHDMIQQDKEACQIENILKAVAQGDMSMLQSRELTYIDATCLPKSLAEAQNLVIKLKDEFDKLPAEVRKEFNNSADMYVNLMGTEEFNNKLAPYNKKIKEIKEAGNLEEYNKMVAERAKFNSDVEAAMGKGE